MMYQMMDQNWERVERRNEKRQVILCGLNGRLASSGSDYGNGSFGVSAVWTLKREHPIFIA
jgi:hypothetical protein